MIKIGTCGYSYYNPGKNWKTQYKNKLQAYSYAYIVGELNRTFYKLPMKKTAARWRRECNMDFEFTVKVWQAITHPVSSPTWRKKKDKLSEDKMEEFGNFGDSPSVLEAWEKTKAIAKALKTEICVFQTSSRFNTDDKNEEAIRAFFDKANLDGLKAAWEPRGDWNENLDKIETICSDLDLIHIVDIMRRSPVHSGDTAYIRLHGLHERETDVNYDYSDEELKQLKEKLQSLEKNYGTVYCMFNNVEMYKNADHLKEMLGIF